MRRTEILKVMAIPDIPYSVCMGVYKNDKPDFFRLAFESMAQQTIAPDEILLVVDGPISTELEQTIQSISKEYPILRVQRFTVNRGQAAVRRAGINAAHNAIVVFMDSDDIAVPNRVELQLQYLQTHPDTDVIGGQIEEFIDDTHNIVGKRVVPLNNTDILLYMKSRCPMNMMTATVRKEAVIKAGNFQDWHYNEDYYLWIRMALTGCHFANLPETLVYARVGKEMYQRRGGWKYFKSERGIQRYMLQHKIISFPRYCYNVLGRFIVQVLMTNRVRGFVFQKLFRK